MKAVILGIFSATSLMVAGSALSAEEHMELLRKSNCLACHKIEGKKVGPSYTEVAQKYKGVANAAATLENKIAHGGNGVWGTMPMPANSPRVTDKDIKTLVAFILSLDK